MHNFKWPPVTLKDAVIDHIPNFEIVYDREGAGAAWVLVFTAAFRPIGGPPGPLSSEYKGLFPWG
jgi:hypothetical protein